MTRSASGLGLPQRHLTRWLVDPGRDVPDAIRAALFNSLYGSVPIFLGGIFNTLLVSGAIAARHPTTLFLAWAGAELALACVRLPVLIAGRRAIEAGRPGPSDLYILLALCWAASVGFGSFICLTSGDWVVATLACLSGAAMVGGVCFRNFAAPRLVAAMIFLSLGPCVAGGLLSGEPILLITSVQIPVYLATMSLAAFRMNRMLVERMQAELEKDLRVRHDALTGLMNRAGLAAELERRAESPDAAGVAYHFLDLDGFKRVNDTLGHGAGDRLLVEVAGRLRAATGERDIVARIGGDEFLIVSPGAEPRAARALGHRVIEALSAEPYVLGDRGVDIGVSVGIALSGDHGESFATLIEAADAALYQAKARGRSQCVLATAGPRLAAESGRRAWGQEDVAAFAATG